MNRTHLQIERAKPVATKATEAEAERAILDTLEANGITAPVHLPKPGHFTGLQPKEGAKGRTLTVYNLWGSFWIVNAPSHVEPRFDHYAPTASALTDTFNAKL